MCFKPRHYFQLFYVTYHYYYKTIISSYNFNRPYNNILQLCLNVLYKKIILSRLTFKLFFFKNNLKNTPTIDSNSYFEFTEKLDKLRGENFEETFGINLR